MPVIDDDEEDPMPVINDDEEESREDNVSVDSLNFSPQSPAPSSSKGEKRKNRSSSPPPNSSRDALLVPASRIENLDDAKKIEMFEQQIKVLQEEAKENAKKFVEILKRGEKEKDNKINMLEREINEKDNRIELLEGEIEEQHKVISHISICASKCLEPKSNFFKGSTYEQLGYASNEEKLKEKICKSSGIAITRILFKEVVHAKFTKAPKYECKLETEKIDLDPTNYDLVVLFKKYLVQCRNHGVQVVCLIVNKAIDEEKAKNLRQYFVDNILPLCEGQKRECNINQNPLQSKENQSAVVKEKKNCTCQGEEEKEEKGFSFTIGCTKDTKGGSLCRYSHKLHLKQPKGKYPLKNYKKKNLTPEEKELRQTFRKTCQNTAVEITEILEKFAPLAHKNMTKTKPNACSLGSSAFCAMTIVSDFTAHQHTDKFDVRDGATALLTLLKDDATDSQYHCLPRYFLKNSTSEKPGVSFKLEHGSVLIESAAQEVHCSTPVKHPNGRDPTRLGLVFYRHNGLDLPQHGFLWANDEESEIDGK
jgi:hypothetical protein